MYIIYVYIDDVDICEWLEKKEWCHLPLSAKIASLQVCVCVCVCVCVKGRGREREK